jgi:hypothetical protein
MEEIRIGSQIWAKENLDACVFANGDSITEAKTIEEWVEAGKNKQPAWCYYENDLNNNEYNGKLYNWYAVNDPRGLSPKGWIIPNDYDFVILSNFFGGDLMAGWSLKTRNAWESRSVPYIQCPNCSNWSKIQKFLNTCDQCKNKREIAPPNIRLKEHQSNFGKAISYYIPLSLFNAYPSGMRMPEGNFDYLNEYASFWCSDDLNNKNACNRNLGNNGDAFTGFDSDKNFGLSVRCIKV